RPKRGLINGCCGFDRSDDVAGRRLEASGLRCGRCSGPRPVLDGRHFGDGRSACLARLDHLGPVRFRQAFTYAEIAGLHPSKTGGTAVHGATAWIRYSRILAPLSLWSNWLAWTPVLAIGTGLGAGYLLSIFYDPSSPVLSWQLTIVDLGFISTGLSLRINATFFLGAAIMLVVFAIQHRGILRTAQIQTLLTIASLLPLFIVCILPLLPGSVHAETSTPFTPLATDNGKVVAGAWDKGGILLFLGGLFIAAWSAYAFETSVCYMSEFKNPGRDMPRAI